MFYIVLKQLRWRWLGSCAIRICEPRQVRKEAAISGTSYVPQIRLFHSVGEAASGQFYFCGAHPRLQKAGLLPEKRNTMYQALYRSFRPETFDAVLGQEHIIKILKNQLMTGEVGHAYLFCGTRGTGKTSMARLLAKGVNCLAPEGERPCGKCENCQSIKEGTFMDVVEIDAASNNGVENIRELRESVKYPPVAGRVKVYIIDEVHMLSSGAFNALLKTLEEPPANVMFILATTEVQKLPATILSRCLRLDFHRIPETELKKGMKSICESIGVDIEDSALGLIAANADGSARDGLSLLDQCVSGGEKKVSRQDVLDILGASGEETFLEMTELVHAGRASEALLLLHRILLDGKDVRQFLSDWIAHLRSLLMIKLIERPEDLLNMSAENIERLRPQSQEFDLNFINNSILELARTLGDARWSAQPRILLELAVVKLAGAMPVSQPVSQQTLQSVSQPQSKQKPEAPAVSVQSELQEIERKTEQKDEQKIEQKSEQKAPAVSDAADDALDLEGFWQRIFEDAQLPGSFHLLRTGTALVSVHANDFTIEAESEMLTKFAESNRDKLEEIVGQKLGRKMRMFARMAKAGGAESPQEDEAQKMAHAMGERLGLNIEIK